MKIPWTAKETNSPLLLWLIFKSSEPHRKYSIINRIAGAQNSFAVSHSLPALHCSLPAFRLKYSCLFGQIYLFIYFFLRLKAFLNRHCILYCVVVWLCCIVHFLGIWRPLTWTQPANPNPSCGLNVTPTFFNLSTKIGVCSPPPLISALFRIWGLHKRNACDTGTNKVLKAWQGRGNKCHREGLCPLAD